MYRLWMIASALRPAVDAGISRRKKYPTTPQPSISAASYIERGTDAKKLRMKKVQNGTA